MTRDTVKDRPMTGNADLYRFLSAGKTDVKKLPPPDWTQLQNSGEYVAPRDELEETLQQVL